MRGALIHLLRGGRGSVARLVHPFVARQTPATPGCRLALALLAQFWARGQVVLGPKQIWTFGPFLARSGLAQNEQNFAATIDGANAKTKQNTPPSVKTNSSTGSRANGGNPGYQGCLQPRPPDLAIDGTCAGNLKADLGRCKSIDVLSVFP